MYCTAFNPKSLLKVIQTSCGTQQITNIMHRKPMSLPKANSSLVDVVLVLEQVRLIFLINTDFLSFVVRVNVSPLLHNERITVKLQNKMPLHKSKPKNTYIFVYTIRYVIIWRMYWISYRSIYQLSISQNCYRRIRTNSTSLLH